MTGRATKAPTDQEVALRDRSVRDFWGHTWFHRKRMSRAGFNRHGFRSLDELQRLPVMTLDDVEDVAQLLTNPAHRSRQRRQYWPLQWVTAAGTLVAYSAEDLALLGELGRDLYEVAGVGPKDVCANLLSTHASRDQLQLQLGAQVGGLSSATFGTGATVEQIFAISPTVITGEVKELNRMLDIAKDDDVDLSDVHTYIVVGALPQARQWKRLLDHFDGDGSRIVRAWAPAGAFALWAQCRGGEGFHTWPAVEVVEIVDPLTGLVVPEGAKGVVVYTGLEWYATAMLRLQTEGVAAMDTATCATCGRRTPRLMTEQKVEGFPAVLDANDNITKWFAELQRSGSFDELMIWLALKDPKHSIEVFADIAAKIGSAHVQVVDVAEVERRRKDAYGERFGDRRALPSL